MNRRPPIGELYRAYFRCLIDVLTEQYHWDIPGRDLRGEYCRWPSDIGRINYQVHFRKRPEQKVFTGLYITRRDFFDILEERESEISAEFDDPLLWDPRQTTYKIGLQQDGDITVDANKLEAIKEWQVENLLKFKRVLSMPEIRRALEKQ